jgi:hypothetical protein
MEVFIMALVKSSLMSQVSGKIGGTVYATGRYGQYARNWVKPVNPNTNKQQQVRSIMGAANQAWSLLTDLVKADWVTYANAVPWLNRIGDAIYLTGKTIFVRTYIARINAGLAMVDAAPTTLLMPQAPVGVASAEGAAATLTWSFTDDQAWNVDEGGLAFYGSGVKAPSVNFIADGGYRGAVEGVTATPLTSPQTVSYPDLTNQSGNRVRVSVRALLPDGRVSAPVSTVVEIG